MATHFSIFAWRIPWPEEPGGLVYRVTKSWTQLKQLSTQLEIRREHKIVPIPRLKKRPINTTDRAKHVLKREPSHTDLNTTALYHYRTHSKAFSVTLRYQRTLYTTQFKTTLKTIPD